jgi:DNA repair exonuclease SbcCD ATPase subunit
VPFAAGSSAGDVARQREERERKDAEREARKQQRKREEQQKRLENEEKRERVRRKAQEMEEQRQRELKAKQEEKEKRARRAKEFRERYEPLKEAFVESDERVSTLLLPAWAKNRSLLSSLVHRNLENPNRRYRTFPKLSNPTADELFAGMDFHPVRRSETTMTWERPPTWDMSYDPEALVASMDPSVPGPSSV